MISRVTELRLISLAGALLAALFIAWPQLDLIASRAFYESGWQYLTEFDGPLRTAIYWATPPLGQGLLLILAILLGLACSKRWPRLRAKRAVIGFLLASALLGPILLVDTVFKNHWGRARPSQVQEFGGKQQFTPAFIPAKECKRNCSFVSGHVATGAFLMAFGWLGAPAIRRRWLLIGLGTAAYLAWTRMSAGGHFLSDTIFAWFATYYGLWLTEIFFRWRGWLPPPPNDKAERST